VTPLNVILGSQASAILILSVVGVVILAATAAMLDFMSGTSRVLAPFAFERARMSVFVGIGLPAAFVLVSAGGFLGGFVSGVAVTGSGTTALLLLVNLAFLVGVVTCGCCSPLARHWGLGMAGFAAGLGAVIPLLAIISALGLGNDSGLLTNIGDRIVFGVLVGAILLAVALCGAALLAMITYIAERISQLLAARHHHADGRSGRLV
jgi:hypothetical protein